MVNLYLAYTAPINPPNASPVLSSEQCWAGLQRKIRNAPEFVGAITKCDVLEDKDGVVTREVVFGARPDTRVKEVCKSFEPMKVSRPGTRRLYHSPDMKDTGRLPPDRWIRHKQHHLGWPISRTHRLVHDLCFPVASPKYERG